jgi:hypothetical protein
LALSTSAGFLAFFLGFSSFIDNDVIASATKISNKMEIRKKTSVKGKRGGKGKANGKT